MTHLINLLMTITLFIPSGDQNFPTLATTSFQLNEQNLLESKKYLLSSEEIDEVKISRAFSGVLVIDPEDAVRGRVRIPFANFPGEDARVGYKGKKTASLKKVRIIGGEGRFKSLPANIVHFREFHPSANNGQSERDDWEINSWCTQDYLEIYWGIDANSSVKEIGFMVIGN